MSHVKVEPPDVLDVVELEDVDDTVDTGKLVVDAEVDVEELDMDEVEVVLDVRPKLNATSPARTIITTITIEITTTMLRAIAVLRFVFLI